MGKASIKQFRNAEKRYRYGIPKLDVKDEARHGKGFEGLLKRYFG